MSSPIIEVKALTLELKTSGVRRETRDSLNTEVGGEVAEAGSRAAIVHALNEVTFNVSRGESMAIVGRNGSGKSTLMRVLAGIYPAMQGTCTVRGRVTTLFSNQLGMNYNATGRENIRLLGILLGLTRRDINRLVDDVAEFSELGDYLDLPVRIYSAGMRTRLGFGVSTGVRPEVLLIDEVFGTGDKQFQAKARERMRQAFDGAATTVMASHSVDILRQFCKTALWLDRGRVMTIGPIDEVICAYNQERQRQAESADIER